MSEHAIENAKAWYESIVEMVAALRDSDDDVWRECSNCAGARTCELNQMCSLGDVSMSEEAAQQRIHESVLSVMVRDGWRNPGGSKSDPPEEYEILLTTGGPALRIYGQLNRHSEPDDEPELQWQDWGTPWTRWLPDSVMGDTFRDTLRTFASQFYFGE